MAHSPLLDTRQASMFAMSDFFVSQTGGFDNQLGHAPEEHAVIIDALEERDAHRARHAAESHIANVAVMVAASYSGGRVPVAKAIANVPA